MLKIAQDFDQQKVFMMASADMKIDLNEDFTNQKLILTNLGNSQEFEIGWAGTVIGNHPEANL